MAYFVSDVVENLDLKPILSVYEAEERGFPPYHPVMMTKVLVYGCCIGVASSRKIERRLVEDVAFRVLAANNTPDFRTIADFRKRHLKALRRLFVEILRLCQESGLVKLGHVALDGTKMKANGSKRKAMSYERMGEEEKRLQGYNCQAAVDGEHQIVVAAEVVQQTNDSGQSVPLIEQLVAHGAPSLRRPAWTPATSAAIPLRTKRGHAVYSRRKAIVEPVFGQIKHGRGVRQFLLRGIEKVRAEWALICMGHNLLKLWRVSATGPPLLLPAAA